MNRPPLPVPLPMDLAEVLGITPSYISHINSGRRTMAWKLCLRVMKIAETDPRLDGLMLKHIWPDLRDADPYLGKKSKSRKKKVAE